MWMVESFFRAAFVFGSPPDLITLAEEIHIKASLAMYEMACRLVRLARHDDKYTIISLIGLLLLAVPP